MVLMSGLAACAVSPNVDEVAEDEAREVWDSANNPAYVDNTFIYEADKLPIAGQMKQAPIPADYWATYRDSINVRWDGELVELDAGGFELELRHRVSHLLPRLLVALGVFVVRRHQCRNDSGLVA